MEHGKEPMHRSMVLFISVIPGEVLDCRVKTLYCHNSQIHQNDDKMLEVLDTLQICLHRSYPIELRRGYSQ